MVEQRSDRTLEYGIHNGGLRWVIAPTTDWPAPKDAYHWAVYLSELDDQMRVSGWAPTAAGACREVDDVLETFYADQLK